MGKASSKQDLSPEDFDELVESTDFTTAEIDLWYQKFQQDFPKGHISPREFKDVYQKLYPAGDADRFCKHIFRVYDTDGNGVISFSEFLTTMHVSAHGTPDDKLRATFRMYDIDSNGFVTVTEITQILTVREPVVLFVFVTWLSLYTLPPPVCPSVCLSLSICVTRA